MKFITLLILTSCTISYFYKGKDLDKNQNKLIKQFNKTLSQFDKAKDNTKVFKQLKSAQVSDKTLTDFSSAMKKCFSYRDQIKALRDDRINNYKKLGINKKKKYSQKDKKYKEIQKYIDSHKPFQAKAEKVFDQTNEACKRPSSVLKELGIKSLDAKALYKKFQGHKKNLKKTASKVKKQVKKFSKKLRKSKHKNKKKIQKKISEIDPILQKLQKQSNILDKHITELEKKYGKKGPILIAKGTLASKKIELLEVQTQNYNKIVSEYDKKIKEINKLVKD